MSASDGTRGRVLALDPGQRRVGVAISDSARTMAFPRPALAVSDDLSTLLDAVRSTVADEGAQHVVVGLPLHLDGRESPSAMQARAMAAALEDLLEGDAVPVELFDERLTTVQATASLRDAGVRAKQARRSVDSAAATVLLEAWLRCH